MGEYKLELPVGENVTEYIKHPALYKHKELLKELVDNRIFWVYHADGYGFLIEECCDNYFRCELTKEQCLELSEMFKEIAEVI